MVAARLTPASWRPMLLPEDVQNYPRPPALEPVPHRLRVEVAGRTVADTANGWRVCETHHAPTYYVPRADVADVLRPARGHSFCEWKGMASYLDVVVGADVRPRAAWTYERPVRPFAALAGAVAFYAGTVDAAWVGDLRVEPQPGDFYGGWVTPNLVGVVKGAPGTEGW